MYEGSVADYENCLAANQMNTCEAERRVMKANKRVLSVTVQRLSRAKTFGLWGAAVVHSKGAAALHHSNSTSISLIDGMSAFGT